MAFFNSGANTLVANSAASAGIEERMSFLKKVYGLLTASLLLAVVAANIGQSLNPGLMMPLFIAEIVMIFVAMGVRRKPYWNVAALFGFTGLSGLTLGPVMLVYNAGVIQEALLLTLVIFGSLTMYVMISKRDFSFLSGFLITGLVVVIIGSLLNVFLFQNPMGEFIISAAGVILFSGFILYDTSNILRHYDVQDYTSATLALYLDVLNLFLFLLRLLGGGRD